LNPLAAKRTRNWSAVIIDRPPFFELVPEFFARLSGILPSLGQIQSTDRTAFGRRASVLLSGSRGIFDYAPLAETRS
jgi:hypothetical protein